MYVAMLLQARGKSHYLIYRILERPHEMLLDDGIPRCCLYVSQAHYAFVSVRAARNHVHGVDYIKISETTHFPTLA